jgi:hypothetical protein
MKVEEILLFLKGLCILPDFRPIIDIPRILQLCEGLYASGQPVDLFVAPALVPVAIDLYCKRNNFGDQSPVRKTKTLFRNLPFHLNQID